MKKMKRVLSTIVILTIMCSNVSAQSKQKKELLYSNKFSILFGMLQPTVAKGFNAEINYTTKRMIFDYSHGISLDPPTVGDFKTQKIALHLPYTTGFGIGYRITSFFDIRFEPKLHSWENYQEGDAQNNTTMINKYKTTTLGFGAYYRFMPFRNSNNKVLQGITTSTSLRWWQNTSTTLTNNKMTYNNKLTNKTETLNAPNIGIANTPIIFNIAIGYTFGGK
jgi:hypothetical protein